MFVLLNGSIWLLNGLCSDSIRLLQRLLLRNHDRYIFFSGDFSKSWCLQSRTEILMRATQPLLFIRIRNLSRIRDDVSMLFELTLLVLALY